MANGLVRRHAPTVVTASAFVVSIVVAWLWLDIDSVERVTRDAGVVGPLLFFAAYVAAMIALVPSTPFNDRLSGERSFAFKSLPLGRIRDVKKHHTHTLAALIPKVGELWWRT